MTNNIPDNLDEAVNLLFSKMTDKERILYELEDEDYPGAGFHFSGGMRIRNNWGLWRKDTGISKWFRENGIWHADDMSGTIYKALWCKVCNKPFDIKKEAKRHEEFWAKNGVGFDNINLDKQ